MKKLNNTFYLCVLAISTQLLAQTSPLAPMPDKLGQLSNGMQDVELQFQNVSGKTIALYSISITAKVDGKLEDQFLKMYVTANPLSFGIKPSGIVSIPVSHKAADPGSVVSFESKVTFVMFSDRTYFGKAGNAYEYNMDGQFSGALMERDRLKKLLTSKGEAAVIEELRMDDGVPRTKISARKDPAPL